MHVVDVHLWNKAGPVDILLPDSASGQANSDLVDTHCPKGHTNTVVNQPVMVGLPKCLQGFSGWPSDPMEYLGH